MKYRLFYTIKYLICLTISFIIRLKSMEEEFKEIKVLDFVKKGNQ